MSSAALTSYDAPSLLSGSAQADSLIYKLKLEQHINNERAARDFIERTLRCQLSSQSLQTILKDGSILCRLVNELSPGTLPVRTPKKMAWEQMESISLFLDGARKLGLKNSELFQTPDLFEGRDMAQVILTLLTLERVVASSKQKTSTSRRPRAYSQLQTKNEQRRIFRENFPLRSRVEIGPLQQPPRLNSRVHRQQVLEPCQKPPLLPSIPSSSSVTSIPSMCRQATDMLPKRKALVERRSGFWNRPALHNSPSFLQHDSPQSPPRSPTSLTSVAESKNRSLSPSIREEVDNDEEPTTPKHQRYRRPSVIPAHSAPPIRHGRRPSELDNLSPVSRGSVESIQFSPTNSSTNTYRYQREKPERVKGNTLVLLSDDKLVAQYQLGNCVGKGQFGAVYRALNMGTGQMVAVKRIKLEEDQKDRVDSLMKEVELLKTLSHPSVVKYEGFIKTEGHLNIILEFVESGSLLDVLKSFGTFPEKLAASYTAKILDGLIYLHDRQVVHCDLKAANLLTTKNGNVKLTDFGVSLNLKLRPADSDVVVGTPYWIAPEVIQLMGASTKSDVWSLGCTVVELITGQPPYADMIPLTALFHIVEDAHPPMPDGISKELEGFLLLCFRKDPEQRATARELLEHPWIRMHCGSFEKALRRQESFPHFRRSAPVYPPHGLISPTLHATVSDKGLQGDAPTLNLDDPCPSTPEPPCTIDQIMLPPSSPPSIKMRRHLSETSKLAHEFVKSSFGKAVVCKVCNEALKRGAVFCQACGLYCHERCRFELGREDCTPNLELSFSNTPIKRRPPPIQTSGFFTPIKALCSPVRSPTSRKDVSVKPSDPTSKRTRKLSEVFSFHSRNTSNASITTNSSTYTTDGSTKSSQHNRSRRRDHSQSMPTSPSGIFWSPFSSGGIDIGIGATGKKEVKEKGRFRANSMSREELGSERSGDRSPSSSVSDASTITIRDEIRSKSKYRGRSLPGGDCVFQ
ncbi:uncharacterized protein VTP21DRAFT_10780 [Calcarisporiella thermophila]|uniref:uncharacterized protein n=1 Tax=Calcarisporiella thermophila TaxID=911321 RepID=UPI00374253DA